MDENNCNEEKTRGHLISLLEGNGNEMEIASKMVRIRPFDPLPVKSISAFNKKARLNQMELMKASSPRSDPVYVMEDEMICKN